MNYLSVEMSFNLRMVRSIIFLFKPQGGVLFPFGNFGFILPAL